MKYIRYIFTIILLLLLLTNEEVEVLAMNTGFTTESLSEEDISTFFKNIDISMLTDEPHKKTIECFDVNGNREIAIGCSDSENKTVCVYTNDGKFQYGYSFECNGSFGIELNQNILLIYFVRSDVVISVNSMGEIESILKIQNTLENNSYWNNYVFSTRRKIGDMEYILKNDFGIFNIFASSYSQLISINKNGEECIIYDVNSVQFFNMVTMFVGILVFVCFSVVIVVRQFINPKYGK